MRRQGLDDLGAVGGELSVCGAYPVYLLLESTAHEALPAFSAVMLWFVLPVAGQGLGIAGILAIGGGGR